MWKIHFINPDDGTLILEKKGILRMALPSEILIWFKKGQSDV